MANMKKTLLIINCIILSLGNCGGPLIMRLYYIHGGNRVWLSAWLETGGWFFTLIPLLISYLHRRRRNPAATKVYIKSRLFCAAAVIGILTGCDDFLYSNGVARLPVSTSTLIISSQLAFTAAFAFLLVKQRFHSYAVNAVFLLTVGAAVLAIHSSGDRPEGESKREYIIGFLMTLGAAALYGFVLPLVELTYKKSKQRITYTLVMEIQMVMCFFGTLFCTVGMIFNNDFKVIPKEAKEFGLGEAGYYVVLVFCGIFWQCFFLGVIGVVFCASSLLSGVLIAVLLPVTEIFAVIFYKEKFTIEKGLSLVLSLWGFVSYFYGEMKYSKKKSPNTPEIEMPQNDASSP